MLKKYLINTLNKFRAAFKSRYLYVKVEENSFNRLFLECLLKERLISYYICDKENSKYIIFLKYDELNNKSLVKDLKLRFKNPFLTIVKAKDLKNKKKLASLKRGQENSLMVLSTNQGMMSEKDAKKKNIGGVLLFVIEYH